MLTRGGAVTAAAASAPRILVALRRSGLYNMQKGTEGCELQIKIWKKSSPVDNLGGGGTFAKPDAEGQSLMPGNGECVAGDEEGR
jgi:hypothetical protein